jgi:hypothetical protein
VGEAGEEQAKPSSPDQLRRASFPRHFPAIIARVLIDK